MNRLGRVIPLVALLALGYIGPVEAQLPEGLQHWLQPLPSCRTLSCIFRNIPSRPLPNSPGIRPWVPSGTGGPITTTPEPLTMALLGTGLAGIGLVGRRRKLENEDVS